MSEIIESTVNAEPVVNVEPQITEPGGTTNEPVNAGSEEVATPQVEEKPVQDAETNSMYAKIRREAEAKAKDEAIAEMGMEWNGKPITTYNQYKQALAEKAEHDKKQAELEKRRSLEEQGIDPNILDQYINENPDVKWAREEREKRAKTEAAWNDFLDVKRDFESIKNPEDVPPEVFEYQRSTGKTLYDSMTWYENKNLKAKLAEYEKGTKTQQINAQNAETSTGSVTGNGATVAIFTQEQVKAMSQKEVDKNYDAIMASMKHWK